MKSHSQYTIVEGYYKGKTLNAFFIALKCNGAYAKIALPRSLIHGADDRLLESAVFDSRVTFRLMIWKAREFGL